MKQKKGFKIFIIVLVVLAIFWTTVILGIFRMNNSFIHLIDFGYKVNKKLVFDESYDYEQIEKITIDSIASEISILKANDQKVKVLIYGKANKIEVDNTNNLLVINYNEKNCTGLCLHRTIGKVTIYLPDDYAKNVVINNDYGNIKIEKFPNAIFDINGKSGNITVKEAKEVTVKNQFGNIEIDRLNSINAINKFGNIKVKTVLESFNIKNKFGNIKISDMVLEKNAEISNHFGSIKIGHTNDIFIDAKNSFGDINIVSNNKNSNIILKITNKFGDIDVKN